MGTNIQNLSISTRGNILNQFANIHHIFVQTSAEQYLSIFTIGRAVEIRRESTGEEGDGGSDQEDKGGHADQAWYDDDKNLIKVIRS